MLPPDLFRRPAFCAATAVAGTMNLCGNGTLFVLTLYLQGVEGRSPLGAALASLPAFAMLSVVGPPAGRAVGRVGPRGPMAAGLVCAASGMALLAAGPSLPAFTLWGAGLGLLTPAVVAASMGAVAPARAGLAAAVNNTARQAGAAIGIAACGALAGSPASSGFARGFHAVVLGGAALYVAAAGLTLAAIPATPGSRARRRSRPARCPRRAAGSAP